MKQSLQEVCEQLLDLVFDMKHDLLEIAEAQGLTVAQLYTLIAITRHGTMPMGKVADVLHCDASNVTGIVDRLVARDFISRRESERDRREKILALTPAGKDVINNYLSILPERLCASKLDDQDYVALAGIFKKLNDSRL